MDCCVCLRLGTAGGLPCLSELGTDGGMLCLSELGTNGGMLCLYEIRYRWWTAVSV